jgi:transcriptional regulator with XRE-family HTH domain
MPELSKVVGSNVRAERARHHWHQAELARRMNWTIGIVSQTELAQRQITLNDVPKLCRALEVPFADLVRGADLEDLSALDL